MSPDRVGHSTAVRRAAGAAVAALTVVLLVATASCQRRIQLVPPGADSTAAGRDSFEIHVREAQQAWDDPQSGNEAAALTAALIREDLARHPDEPWPPRVRAVLDSLDVGAEVAADRRVVVANFFSRAHPDAGSWPWLFWPTSAGAQARALSGKGLQLLQVASRARGADVTGVAVLFGRRGASGQEPVLLVWNDLAHGSPEPSQTLGPDSLGGFGTGNFETGGDTAVAIVTRTFHGMPRFEECATCPHVFSVRRFVWDGPGFHRQEERLIPSPYSSFVQFVVALAANDVSAAMQRVGDPLMIEVAKRYGMDVVSRGNWRVAPSTDETAHQMTFFRGAQEAYTVSFEERGDDWVITSIVPTTRTVE